MGRSDKRSKDEEAQRKAFGAALASVAPPSNSDSASAATLNSFNAAAAVEALLKQSQGHAALAHGARPNDQMFLGAGFDHLQSLSRNSALLQRVAKSVLPRSAPVSSLLPPLPQDGLSPQGLLALQTHLASIGAAPGSLIGGSSTASLDPSRHGGSDISSVHQLLAAQTASKQNIANVLKPNMQTWSLAKLDQHVNLLRQLKQPVPESMAVLLADAKRKEAKKTAKRLANRKSASSSRARKKALVQEMTELNARLKRQAQILSLLPDLVITINLEGVITFCSAQVERVLHHSTRDIVGAELATLLIPTSKDKLNRLVQQLVASEQMAILGVTAAGTILPVNEAVAESAQAPAGNADGNSAALNSGAEVSEAAVVSEPSFPMSVVKVKAKDGSSDENENSDNSTGVLGSKGPSSLTQDSGASIPRSPSASVGNSGSDDAKNVAKSSASKKNCPSSDLSNSSSVSTSANKLQKANQNLEKNVRAHNKKMKKGSASYRDDVTGADVTANNASARLSSLQHRSESSSEEDSGYRESNDSREETSSSASDSSDSNGRRKPLAPTCTICLIRKDKTTIWCEVTSSIRTVEIPREPTDTENGGSEEGRKSGTKVGSKSEEGSAPSEPDLPTEKELLLCLRPIRDGEMEKKSRFACRKKKSAPKEISTSMNLSDTAKPPKKRRPESDTLDDEPPAKRAAPEPEHDEGQMDTEVVESLMSMNKQASA